VQVEIGKPLLPRQIEQLSERDLAAEVERRVRQCHQLARDRRQRRMAPAENALRNGA
jgi:phage FluMu protein gp41